MEKELISQVEFARRNGVSQPAIAKWVKLGKLPMEGTKIIMPDAQYVYNDFKAFGKVSTSESSEISNLKDFNEARTEYQIQSAELKKLQVKKLQGDLISVEQVIKEVEAVATVLRNDMFALPSKLAPLCEGKTIAQIEQIIHNSINDAFTLLNNFDYYQFGGEDETQN
jgi:transcriptional regulator with XRE-family HTH domain